MRLFYSYFFMLPFLFVFIGLHCFRTFFPFVVKLFIRSQFYFVAIWFCGPFCRFLPSFWECWLLLVYASATFSIFRTSYSASFFSFFLISSLLTTPYVFDSAGRLTIHLWASALFPALLWSLCLSSCLLNCAGFWPLAFHYSRLFVTFYSLSDVWSMFFVALFVMTIFLLLSLLVRPVFLLVLQSLIILLAYIFLFRTSIHCARFWSFRYTVPASASISFLPSTHFFIFMWSVPPDFTILDCLHLIFLHLSVSIAYRLLQSLLLCHFSLIAVSNCLSILTSD
jgi:hypothetical protein